VEEAGDRLNNWDILLRNTLSYFQVCALIYLIEYMVAENVPLIIIVFIIALLAPRHIANQDSGHYSLTDNGNFEYKELPPVTKPN